MKFGIGIPNYGSTLSVDGLQKVALEAEELGYDSIWTTDHVLMPRDSGTPYERILDSIVSLAYLAPQTKRVRLGISSLIIAMRNPVVVAKQLASVDAFSGGRLMLAVGVGWNEREFAFLGSDFHDRGKRVDESILMLRDLWSRKTDFRGKFLRQSFEQAVFEPVPHRERLPIWIGGVSEAAMMRAIKLGDAWHPNVYPLATFRELVSKFRELATSSSARETEICVRIGLDHKATKSEYVGAQGEKRIMLTGDLARNKEVVGALEELGVSYAVVVPSSDGRVEPLDQVTSMRTFANQFL